MILDISDVSFKNVLNDEELFLPIRWDGADFNITLDRRYQQVVIVLQDIQVYI